MKNPFFLIAFLCIFYSTSFAQQLPENNSSKLLLTPTANLSSNYGLTINTSTLVGSAQNDLFRGYVVFNIAGLAEIDYSMEGYVTDLVENTDKIGTLGLKFKILSQRDKHPSVSLAIRSSVNWRLTELFSKNIENNNPILFKKGLDHVHYDYRITIVSLIFSQNISRIFNLTAGIGIQELQYKDVWIFDNSQSPIINHYNTKDLNRNLLLHGFFNGNIVINNNISVITEFNSLPHLTVNLNDYKLTVNRSYVAAFGIRYSLSDLFAIDTAVWHYTNFEYIDKTQFRIGLNTSLDFN